MRIRLVPYVPGRNIRMCCKPVLNCAIGIYAPQIKCGAEKHKQNNVRKQQHNVGKGKIPADLCKIDKSRTCRNKADKQR